MMSTSNGSHDKEDWRRQCSLPMCYTNFSALLLGCATIIVSVLRILMVTTFLNIAVILGNRAQSQRIIAGQRVRKQWLLQHERLRGKLSYLRAPPRVLPFTERHVDLPPIQKR